MGEVKTTHAVVATLVVAVSSALVLIGIEVALRWNGYRPWQFARVDLNEPTIYVPDPVVGWKPKPGRYVFPPYSRGAAPTHVTILPDGARSTGMASGGDGMKLFFVGASFTQGWAVSDHETYAWKVQERFPELAIHNYAIGAYGTFQSLLSLEKLLADSPRPDWVVYDLDDVLEERNVAAPRWLRQVALFSKRAVARVPYCTLRENGELARHPPEQYPAWPLREHLAIVATAERIYAERRGKARSLQQRDVTKKLLLEMKKLVESNGVRFTIVLINFFDTRVKAEYAAFLQSNGIDFVDCAFPLTPDMQVQGEGHANGKMHTRWANCIAEAIERRLPEGQATNRPQ